jgi:hypothetical protein
VWRWRRNEHLEWRALILLGVLSTASVMALPGLSRAQGFFDFLFGGSQQRQAPPPDVYSRAPPSPSVGRVAPPPMTGTESVHQAEGEGGRSMAHCVRLCDGQHFPLERLANATSIETCRAMCPASKTKVFLGSEIGGAVASDGARYTDLDTAFAYRKQLVSNCTCNGKDAFGLVPLDVSRDPTLRPGDIVSTKDGLKAYNGTSGR